ncbi:homeobox protein vex1-like [Anomaloglossus baeobatrachus]|uniref:homeobox protein vex1-like n=1 Tax=Anomaloglossus baeobatrachus TaxID=238106 RepID=UPI003F4FE926
METRYFSVEWLSESSHRTTSNEAEATATSNEAGTIVTHEGNATQGATATSNEANISTNATHFTTLPNVDLLRRRMDQVFNQEEEYNFSLPSEMENHIENKIALSQGPSTSQGSPTSRRALQDVSSQTTTPVLDRSPLSDSDSMRSPGSMSEEESTSRPRTKFTTEQLEELEKSFKNNQYIGAIEKRHLSGLLHLSETQIKTWFQNRRMKYKRQSKDARYEAVFSGVCFPYYNSSDFPASNIFARSELTLPMAPMAPLHPYMAASLPTAVVRPPFHAAPITPPNIGSLPCPSLLVHPRFNDPMSHNFKPY